MNLTTSRIIEPVEGRRWRTAAGPAAPAEQAETAGSEEPCIHEVGQRGDRAVLDRSWIPNARHSDSSRSDLQWPNAGCRFAPLHAPFPLRWVHPRLRRGEKLACFWAPMEYPSARMSTRATAQLFLVVVLGIAFLATIAIGMYAAFVAPMETVSNVKVLVNTLLPAETALLGTAVAFYFRGGPREGGPRPPRGSS